MKLVSDFKKDIPIHKCDSGSYNWWYFDGSDLRGEYQFVIIFYEGCPFSTKYIRSFEKYPDHVNSKAESHPAVSISVYKNGKTIFYSLSEYSPTEVDFNRGKISVRIGKNTLEGFVENGQLTYALRMEEYLPNGDKFSALLRFISPLSSDNIWHKSPTNNGSNNHVWNLVQPRAHVKGVLSVSQSNRHEKPIIFEGTGYHDQNIGNEPLKNSFQDWYWGRVHFGDFTLVYYFMNQSGKEDYKAWLISADNKSIVEHVQNIVVGGLKTNSFLLASARRINLEFKSYTIQVLAEETLDSGPFYMRFKCTAEMMNKSTKNVELSIGIGEYIKPSRIHWRVFWPLVNMRYRYTYEKPHWVQKTRQLYRWTW
jgi:carotenoid 1,2-hydratase